MPEDYGKRDKHDFYMELRMRYFNNEYGALFTLRFSPGFKTSEGWFWSEHHILHHISYRVQFCY